MDYPRIEELARFSRQTVTPHVCIADGRQHVRAFLAEALEELGFTTCECARASDMVAVLDTHLPELVVLPMSASAVAAGEMLKALAAKAFGGKVLLLGPNGSSVVEALCEMGENLGVAMLAPLATPFRTGGLHASVAAFLAVPLNSPVDTTEIMRSSRSLCYQPKIDTPALALHDDERFIPIRHRTGGGAAAARSSSILPFCVQGRSQVHRRVRR
jgi:CheY-like chemotaxis protein